MPRCEKSFHSTVLIVPSGFIANEPEPVALCPVSVDAETAPSIVEAILGDEVAPPAPPAPASRVMFVCTPPAQPPPPIAWIRLFQLARAGSQTSMPMPAEVEGKPAGPGLPGPTSSLTTQTSLSATGGAGVAGVPDRASASPLLNALTSSTVVRESGLNSSFIVSSQASSL